MQNKVDESANQVHKSAAWNEILNDLEKAGGELTRNLEIRRSWNTKILGFNTNFGNAVVEMFWFIRGKPQCVSEHGFPFL